MKADLGLRSTPVEEHELAGLRFRVWREDLVGGNKYRGLEHLLGKPAKRLLTISTLSANQALATARAGRQLGLDTDAIIVRWGKAGPVLEALRTEANVIEVNGVVGAVFAALRRWRPGTRVIPPGGASALGARGYRDAVLALDEIPTRIWLPVGTGNTASGILAGLLQRDAACEVVGVRVIRGTNARAIWRRADKVSSRRDRAASCRHDVHVSAFFRPRPKEGSGFLFFFSFFFHSDEHDRSKRGDDPPSYFLSLSLSLSLSPSFSLVSVQKRLERELGRVMGRKVEKQKISRSALLALSLSLSVQDDLAGR